MDINAVFFLLLSKKQEHLQLIQKTMSLSLHPFQDLQFFYNSAVRNYVCEMGHALITICQISYNISVQVITHQEVTKTTSDNSKGCLLLLRCFSKPPYA